MVDTSIVNGIINQLITWGATPCNNSNKFIKITIIAQQQEPVPDVPDVPDSRPLPELEAEPAEEADEADRGRSAWLWITPLKNG
jgi:hypothetical protein